MTNTKKLREIIDRKGMKYCFLASQLGITPYSLQKKIDGVTDFKGKEIYKLASILQLTDAEKNVIFFAQCVDE